MAAHFGADGGTRTRTPIRETDFRTTSAFAATVAEGRSGYARSADRVLCSWSGLSLHLGAVYALGAARLVSTPSSAEAWLGIGLGKRH
jgi:hypothetical protein